MPLQGTCHCKAFTFEVDVAPEYVVNCTCTFCSKRGVLWAYYEPQQVRLTSHESVATYQKAGSPIKHHHCNTCGCGTYTESPDFSSGQPDFERPRYGINARLFDDLDLSTLSIKAIDGRNLW